jgi:hypothetical protein
VGISTEVWVDELSYALLILEDIDYVWGYCLTYVAKCTLQDLRSKCRLLQSRRTATQLANPNPKRPPTKYDCGKKEC